MSLAIIGAVYCYKKYKKYLSAALVIMGGFFIDLDHLIDYFLNSGFGFNLMRFITGASYIASGRAFIIFHAWEWLLGLVLLGHVTKKQYFFYSLALGMFLHLCLDQVTNSVGPFSYFMTFRLLTNFSLTAFTRGTL